MARRQGQARNLNTQPKTHSPNTYSELWKNLSCTVRMPFAAAEGHVIARCPGDGLKMKHHCKPETLSLLHDWNSIDNLHVYSSLSLSTLKNVKCYPPPHYDKGTYRDVGLTVGSNGFMSCTFFSGGPDTRNSPNSRAPVWSTALKGLGVLVSVYLYLCSCFKKGFRV